MLDSHGLILFLLWLLAAAGVVMFVRWLNQFLERFDLERDTRLLVMIAFTGIVVFGVLNFLWDIAAEQRQQTAAKPAEAVVEEEKVTDVDAFIQSHHATLYDFRFKLQHRLKALQTFFQNVQQLAKDSPHMKDFLQDIINIRWDTQQALLNTNDKINASLHEFWLHYTTEEPTYVAQVFSKTADELTGNIQGALYFDAASDKREQGKIQAMLKSAGQQLDNNGIPFDPGNRRKLLAFDRYLEPNVAWLRTWLLERNQQGVVAQIDKLLENQQIIQRKAEEVQASLQAANNEALRKAIQDVEGEWVDTSRENQYALYQILYAAELLYVLEKITDVNDDNGGQADTREQASQLLVHLQQAAPVIVDLAWKKRTEGVERSYNPTQFFDGKKSR